MVGFLIYGVLRQKYLRKKIHSVKVLQLVETGFLNQLQITKPAIVCQAKFHCLSTKVDAQIL